MYLTLPEPPPCLSLLASWCASSCPQHRVIPVDAWASFIRTGGDPAGLDARIEIHSDVRAERFLPAQGAY